MITTGGNGDIIQIVLFEFGLVLINIWQSGTQLRRCGFPEGLVIGAAC